MNIDQYIRKSVRKELGMRSYRDSRIAIYRRRYIDAMRAYRDAEERAEASRLSLMVEKINQKLSQFKNEHPSVANFLRIFFKISSVLSAIGGGAGAGYLVARLSPLVKSAKPAFRELEAAGFIPKPLLFGIGTALSGLSAFVNYALSRKLEEDPSERR